MQITQICSPPSDALGGAVLRHNEASVCAPGFNGYLANKGCMIIHDCPAGTSALAADGDLSDCCFACGRVIAEMTGELARGLVTTCTDDQADRYRISYFEPSGPSHSGHGGRSGP